MNFRFDRFLKPIKSNIKLEILLMVNEEELKDIGSLNHSFAQARLTTLLSVDERFITFVELSLDVSQVDMSQFGLKVKEEIKPDICLYNADENSPLPDPMDDVLRVSQMPALAIEIISPRQCIDDILAKFKVYFELGIKSCWLVTPAFEAITVYSGFRDFKLFDVRRDKELNDEVLDIHLQFDKVFRNKK